MRKIKTIFERDFTNNGKVKDNLVVDFDFENAIATEKIDGTNIRVTIREGKCVRIEKRRNPSKKQKKNGIIEPWYVDASRNEPADQYIVSAVDNTNFENIPDGEWSGEAYGEKIQGNPLNIKGQKVFLFSVEKELKKIKFDNVPTEFNLLKNWLKNKKSIIGNGPIEGIVWHNEENMVKIKSKDF